MNNIVINIFNRVTAKGQQKKKTLLFFIYSNKNLLLFLFIFNLVTAEKRKKRGQKKTTSFLYYFVNFFLIFPLKVGPPTLRFWQITNSSLSLSLCFRKPTQYDSETHHKSRSGVSVARSLASRLLLRLLDVSHLLRWLSEVLL